MTKLFLTLIILSSIQSVFADPSAVKVKFDGPEVVLNKKLVKVGECEKETYNSYKLELEYESTKLLTAIDHSRSYAKELLATKVAISKVSVPQTLTTKEYFYFGDSSEKTPKYGEVRQDPRASAQCERMKNHLQKIL